jgi:predicted dehydrogenase
MKRYRVGIIGCGNIARSHMRGHRAVPSVDVVAAADVDEPKLGAFAETWGIPNRYTDYKVMLEREKPDLISICTWPHLHCQITVDAAAAGVPGIYCEKAMAIDLAECDRMVAACDASGSKLLVDHIYRYEPNYHRVKSLLEAGTIGEIRTITGNCLTPPRNPNSWIAQVEYAAGGLMINQGTHVVDLLRWYAGPIDWVVGGIRRTVPETRIEQTAWAVLGARSGANMFFESAENREYPGFEITIQGSKGRIYIGQDEPFFYIWRGGWNTAAWEELPTDHDEPQVKGFANAVTDLIGAVSEDRDPLSNGREARDAHEVLMAIYESHRRGGARIPLPLAEKANPLKLMLDTGVL